MAPIMCSIVTRTHSHGLTHARTHARTYARILTYSYRCLQNNLRRYVYIVLYIMTHIARLNVTLRVAYLFMRNLLVWAGLIVCTVYLP